MSLWIKFDHWTLDKPEVFHIAERLGIDPDAVIGKLLRIWVWADQNTDAGNAKGNAPSVTKTLLDRLACVPGFTDAMISSGWLSQNGDGLHFTNFDRHNGSTAKTRALTAIRQAKHKASASDTKTGNAKVTQQVTQQGRKSNAACVTSALPEERRGEESTLSSKEESVWKPKSRKAFVPPTLEEIIAYVETRTIRINPTKFKAHYDSIDWFVGKKKMVNWRQAVVTWEQNQTEWKTPSRDRGSTQPDCLDAANYVGAPNMSESEIGDQP